MNKDIQIFVVECEICQRNKNENVMNPGLLHPLHIPDQIDKLTKYVHFMAVRKTDSTKQIADVFCKNIYKLHGFPKAIVKDMDAKFKVKFWRDFYKQTRMSLNMIFSYHPQTDGQTEIVNKCLATCLWFFMTDKKNKWSQWLHFAEWWYNSTYHTFTKMTPFQVVYGYEPPKWKEFALINTKVQVVRNKLEEE
jgi:hypothetical protein